MRHARRFLHIITGNKRRKMAAAATTLLVIAGSALAYFLLQPGGSGQVSGVLGTTSGGTPLTLSGIIPNGLTPGNSVNVPVTVTNGNSEAAQLNTLSVQSISTSAGSSCPGSWFTFSPSNNGSLPLQVAANSSQTIGGSSLSFNDSGGDQSACSGATVTVTLSGT